MSTEELRLKSVSAWLADLRAAGMPPHEVVWEGRAYLKRREQLFNGNALKDRSEGSAERMAIKWARIARKVP